MTDKQDIDTLKALGLATGHYSWAYDDSSHTYVTMPLSDELWLSMRDDIEGLDGRVSPRELPEGTALVMHHDDAVDFIEREGRDRAHLATPSEDKLAFLNSHYPALFWQKHAESEPGANDGWYTGSGYDLGNQAAIIAAFRVNHVTPKQVDVPTNHDDATHGLMLRDDQVDLLMEKQQEIAR